MAKMKLITRTWYSTSVKTTLALALLFVVVLVGAYLVNGRSAVPILERIQAHSTTSATSTAETASAEGTTYTLAQIATHNTVGNCWTTISGGVYNLTSWVREHPGGEGPILNLCGRDGTNAFLKQHGHDARPKEILATFKIGDLGT